MQEAGKERRVPAHPLVEGWAALTQVSRNREGKLSAFDAVSVRSRYRHALVLER